jgi:hypothetical protein
MKKIQHIYIILQTVKYKKHNVYFLFNVPGANTLNSSAGRSVVSNVEPDGVARFLFWRSLGGHCSHL